MFSTGLIHKGAVGAGGGFFLQTPGIGASYIAYKTGVPNQTSTITLTIKTDGTWEITYVNYSSGSPSSGQWGNIVLPGVGSEYEVLFQENSGSGGIVTNDAPVWARLTANKSFQISVTDTSGGDGLVAADRNVTVTVRKFGTTTPISTDIVDLQAQAEKT